MNETTLRVWELLEDELGMEAQPQEAGQTLADLGADSLDVVAVALALEEVFGMAIDEAQVTGQTTVAELVRLVDERAGV